MKVHPNIGILNALIRITIGFTLLSWGTAKLVKRPWCESYLFIIIMAAMKIAEGIVRFCPVTALYENCQAMKDDQKNEQKPDMAEEMIFPHNPT